MPGQPEPVTHRFRCFHLRVWSLLTAAMWVSTIAHAQTAATPRPRSQPMAPGEWQRLMQQPEGPTTTPRIHDPVIAAEGGRYYVFSTGPGIKIYTSADRVTWERTGKVFDTAPAWTGPTIPGSRDYFWAPDISFFNGKWHLYYSVSTFGKNRSAIGLATNATLDPKRPDYAWQDLGPVIESNRGDQWNAIDPNIAFDAEGQPWMTLGSYWSGIKLIRLDPETGRPAKDAPLLSIASRPEPKEAQGAVEAPFIFKHGAYYYLFTSFDQCCRGADSTYNIRVGRSKALTGPYEDRTGIALMNGGGTAIKVSEERWRGPGHNAVFSDGGKDYLVYHSYDADDRGISKLRIEEITWDAEGWPKVSAASDATPVPFPANGR